MDKCLTNEEILFRLGYFRNKKNLSARELSLRMGFCDSEINRIERGIVKLKLETLLSILEVFEISPLEFFYPVPENYSKDRELIELISKLNDDKKEMVIKLINYIK